MTDFDYERFFMMSEELLCVFGADQFFRRVNPAFSRALGWSEKELLERSFKDLLHPEDFQRTSDEVETLGEGIPSLSFRNRPLCKDGSYREVLWDAFQDPRTGLMYAAGKDVTEKS